MIEKMLKIVKSSNKKKGRNITIGAVVGFLLSCTGVMGADEYLWIKEDGGTIQFTKEKDTTGSGTGWGKTNPYTENNWNGSTYINNMTLSSSEDNGKDEDGFDDIGYGLRLSGDLSGLNFINNGSIAGTGSGIYSNTGTIRTLINNGLITAGIGDGNSGIFTDATIIALINNGLITTGTGDNNFGIYSNTGTIRILINNGLITTEAGDNNHGIYNYGTIRTLINNELIATGVGNNNSGIYNGDEIGTLINNGLITIETGYGIYNANGEITTLINNGSIIIQKEMEHGVIYNTGTITTLINSGLMTVQGYIYGIDNESAGTITTLINSGLMTATGTNLYVIYNQGNNIGTLINSGSITAAGDDESYGVINGANMGTLINNGLIKITGNASNEGIANMDVMTALVNSGLITAKGNDNGSKGITNIKTIGTLTNTGIVYGDTNAVSNESGATIENLNNYGILAAKDTVIDDNGGIVNDKHMGLVFKINTSNYEAKTADFENFGKTHKDEEIIIGYEKDNDGNLDLNKPIKKQYTIINAKANGTGENNITGTESLKLENGTLSYNNFENKAQEEKISLEKGYVLNGITDTLKITGRENILNDSVINAYKTAVVMDGDMSTLTLNNTAVNGGISDDSTVNITGDGNTFTIQGDSTVNSDDTAITITGNNNVVDLEGNTVVNGKMESTGNNTLNLNGNAENGMNMLHNISGFTNMNIENNVTFFEDVKVTGSEIVTVDKNGVLNLRLKKSDITTYSTIPTAVHAFSERDGKHDMVIKGTSQEEAGTLNFMTNGIGREIYVDMENIELENIEIKTSSIIDSAEIHKDYIHLGAGSDLSRIINPRVSKYDSLNEIYKSLYSSTGENLDALRDMLSMTYLGKNYDYNNATDEEQLKILMRYLNGIYTDTPYSFSSELSRKSMGMFRDIITENQFKPNLNQWIIMGGLTHADGGAKDSYYGQNYHGFDTNTADTDVDMKLTGAYALGKYGYSENVSLGITAGGNKSEAELSMSKVKGNSGYIGVFAENYRGNLILKAGAGIQYSEYDADRTSLGGHSYNEKYSDMAYDIYLTGRYSNPMGDNLYLEPYGTLSYTYVDQDGADEGSKALAIETDSKSFDYTSAKVGVDLKKIIPHEKGKSTLSAGVSYTRLLNGAYEEYITGRFKGGSDFDILVAHKNEHSIGLNAKYTLELKNGILFDVKGSYNVERDSHNGTGKNKTKGEWIAGAGLGYKF